MLLKTGTISSEGATLALIEIGGFGGLITAEVSHLFLAKWAEERKVHRDTILKVLRRWCDAGHVRAGTDLFVSLGWNPGDVRYGQYAQEHLESGYAALWKAWQGAKGFVDERNTLVPGVNQLSRDTLLREARRVFPQITRMESYDSDAREAYFEVQFHRFIQDAISEALRGRRDPTWHVGPFGGPEGTIGVAGTAVLHVSGATPDEVRRILESTVTDTALLEARRRIFHLYGKAEEHLSQFRSDLDQELQKVELGEGLKGKCTLGL